MGTLEFRPSDAWISTIDAFHSEAKQEDTANQFEVNLGDYNGGFGRINITNPQINGNNTFTGGTAANLYPLVRGMYNKRKDTINAFAWKNEFFVGRAKLLADLSWSKADRNELSLENNTQLVPVPQLDTLQLEFSSDGFSQLNPGLNYSDPSKLLLRGTIYGSGYGKTPKVADELLTVRLGATIPAPEGMGWLSDIDFGLNYADRSKDKRQPEGNINVGAQGDTTIGSEFQYGLVDLGFAGVGFIPSWNVPGAVAKYMTFNPVREPVLPDPEGVDGGRDHHHRLPARQHRHRVGLGAGARQHRRADPARRPVVGLAHTSTSTPARRSGNPVRSARQDVHRRAAEPEPGVLAQQRPDPARCAGQAGGASARRPAARLARVRRRARRPASRVLAAATRCSIRGAPTRWIFPTRSTSAPRPTWLRRSSTRT